MPKIKVKDITLNYEQQGTGEPLVLIPYLAADNACYAFQVADYAKQFSCISIDLRGTGESDKPGGAYSTELLADDVAALMQAIGVEKGHIAGVSLGAAAGIVLGVGLTKLIGLTPLGGMIPGAFSPGLFIQVFVIALLLGALGGLYPAVRAANLRPVEAIRHE